MKIINSIADHTSRQVHLLGPFDRCERKAAMSNQAISARIPSLLLPCGPAAIAWEIAKIIILTLDRHSSMAWSHIAQKGFKALAPLFTHRNSARAVIFISLIVWIKATFFGVLPRFILSRALVTTGMAMRHSRWFVSKTTTAFSVAAPQLLTDADSSISALALTKPLSLTSFSIASFLVPELLQHRPTAKSLADDINKIIVVAHVQSISFCLRKRQLFEEVNG